MVRITLDSMTAAAVLRALAYRYRSLKSSDVNEKDSLLIAATQITQVSTESTKLILSGHRTVGEMQKLENGKVGA